LGVATFGALFRGILAYVLASLLTPSGRYVTLKIEEVMGRTVREELSAGEVMVSEPEAASREGLGL
jgi:hypothetical protein